MDPIRSLLLDIETRGGPSPEFILQWQTPLNDPLPRAWQASTSGRALFELIAKFQPGLAVRLRQQLDLTETPAVSATQDAALAALLRFQIEAFRLEDYLDPLSELTAALRLTKTTPPWWRIIWSKGNDPLDAAWQRTVDYEAMIGVLEEMNHTRLSETRKAVGRAEEALDVTAEDRSQAIRRIIPVIKSEQWLPSFTIKPGYPSTAEGEQ